MLTTVRDYYPNAISYRDFILNTFRVIHEQTGLSPNELLLGHALCSDDVNSIQYPEEGRAMLGPFNLGGLGGYPFAGQTGMSAFAHHVPDNGAALVVFGPHIGISNAGELGKIRRVGQQQDSGCCGAALLALDRLKRGLIQPGSKSDTDFQQETLQQALYAQHERVLEAEYPLKEATEVIYEATQSRIDELFSQTDFLGRYVILAGAILINTHFQSGAFLELRRFRLFDAQTKALITEVSF